MLTSHPLTGLDEFDVALAGPSMPAARRPRRRTAFEALRLLREPVPEEKRQLMRARWESLDPQWRTLGQGLGQQATGCGATIGVHPGCDFACTGCYLGADANRVAPIGLEETFRQLDRLRAWLGPKGNAQITNGEVTLLPGEDLVTILRYARRIGLIPIVMTHGDTFRRRLGLLERLMTEAGLTEVSIHIDTTQRGRLGSVLARYGLTRRGQRALTFGHPECTRIEPFGVYERAGYSPRLLPILRDGHEADTEMMRKFFERGLGGLNFRDDTSLERVCRAAGVLLTDPRWVLGPLRRWILERLAGLGTNAPRLAWNRALGRVRVDRFCVVSHHFMDSAELASDTGQERLSACLFRVPVADEMVPMCRVNAGGVRDAVYTRLRTWGRP